MVHPLTYFLKKTLFKKKINSIKKSAKFYEEIVNPQQIVKIQIKQFNLIWGKAQLENAFYKLWKSEHNLPNQVSSINEIVNFPTLTKTIINERYELISLRNKYRTTYTGGTSGVTTLFPTDNIESYNAYVASYTGRLWWGIHPLSDIIMLWGHSHLFEKGFQGKYQKITRKIKDYLINTKRFSSYNLSEGNLEYFFNIINKTNPSTIISYSGNIFKLAKFIDEKCLELKFGKVKNVIVTSEPLYAEDILLIKRTLAQNVINEYGMAETGVIGYSKDTTQCINIFWNNFILTKNKNSNLYLTTLSDRIFPLINYDTEDKIEPILIKQNSVLKIKEILGKARNNLQITLENKKIITISTIFFDHLLKHLPNIYSIQYLVKKDINYIILNTTKKIDLKEIHEECIKKITENFGIPNRNKIKIQTRSSSKTIAGKHSTFIK
jgi:phenylacetate-CoA ligase